MQPTLVQLLQTKVDTIEDKGEAFCHCLDMKCGEEGLTNSFKTFVLEKIAKSDDSIRVGIPQTVSPAPSFFGYKPQHSDLFLEWTGKKVLLECKILKDKGQYDVRNAFSQLLEYLLSMEWDEGCVLIFDIRNTVQRDIFTGSEEAELNRWFVQQYSNLLSTENTNQVPFTNWNNRHQVSIAAVRVYADHGKLCFEACP